MDPVETVVVGDGRRLVTELHRRLDEVFRMRSSVEKGEVGVTVVNGRRAALPSTGSDGPWNPAIGKIIEQLLCTREGPHLIHSAGVRLRMSLLQLLRQLRAERPAGLS